MEVIEISKDLVDWSQEAVCPMCGSKVRVTAEDIFKDGGSSFHFFTCLACNNKIIIEKWENGRFMNKLFDVPEYIIKIANERWRKAEERAVKKSKRKVSIVLLTLSAIFILVGLLTPAHDLAVGAIIPIFFMLMIRIL